MTWLPCDKQLHINFSFIGYFLLCLLFDIEKIFIHGYEDDLSP